MLLRDGALLIPGRLLMRWWVSRWPRATFASLVGAAILASLPFTGVPWVFRVFAVGMGHGAHPRSSLAFLARWAVPHAAAVAAPRIPLERWWPARRLPRLR